MLKSLTPVGTKFYNFRCGEVYCLSSNSYLVTCCLCGEKILFAKFTEHFERHHLGTTPATETAKRDETPPPASFIRDVDPTKSEDVDEIANMKNNSLEALDEGLDEKPIDFVKLQLKPVVTTKKNVEDDSESSDDEDKDWDFDNLSDSDHLGKTSETETAKREETQPSAKFICDDDPIKSVAVDEIANMKNNSMESLDEGLDKKPIEFIELQLEPVVTTKKNVDDGEPSDNGDKDWDFDKLSDSDESDWIAKSKPTTFKCPECKRIYKSQSALSNHRRVHHYITIDDINSEDENNVPCMTCPRFYKSRRTLLKHLRTGCKGTASRQKPRRVVAYKTAEDVTKETSADDATKETSAEDAPIKAARKRTDKDEGNFCDICGKQFTHWASLNRHKVRHSGIKSHKCKECDNCFFTENELKAHMMRHTQIFPHVCEVCGRKCRDGGVLSAHMRRHTGERPAECKVCGKRFYSIHDLNLHSVIHSTERPFKCDTCGATFQRKKSLRIHKKLHSTERNHECKVCGKAFAQAGGLVSHMRSHDATFVHSALPPSVEVGGNSVGVASICFL